MKRYHNHGNSYKAKHLIGAGLHSVRSLVPYHHDRKNGRMQEDMVLEKELRFLWQAASGKGVTH